MNRLPGLIPKKSQAVTQAPYEKPVPHLNRELMIVESESSEGLTLEEIIRDKPRTKIVREFFKENLAGIKSEEQQLFEK